jgi:uncharacterized protein YecE (DUF72 family)
MRIQVGTSGYLYKHWNNGVFYPRGVKDRLAHAMARMTAMEINSSFYRIPPPDTVAAWADSVPDGRSLVLKAPQSVSHRRRLKLHSEGGVRQGADLLAYFIEGVLRIAPDKRGPVLLQLPGQMQIDLARLEPVLALFAAHGVKLALEIRHASWFVAATLALLENTAPRWWRPTGPSSARRWSPPAIFFICAGMAPARSTPAAMTTPRWRPTWRCCARSRPLLPTSSSTTTFTVMRRGMRCACWNCWADGTAS